MAYFDDYQDFPVGNAWGYMPIPKLIEILQSLPQDGFVSTGFNSLPVMTVWNGEMKQIGMIEPHHETFDRWGEE